MNVLSIRAVFLFAALCTPASGATKEDTHVFDIPAGDTEFAVTIFARQAHRQIIVPGDSLTGVQTPPIRGELCASSALQLLLKDTNLVIVSDDGRTIVVQRRESKPADQKPSPAPTMATSDPMEQITVKGYKVALVSATDWKRNAAAIGDAVFADAIGKFPDSNLASALMRIPGVSATRAATMAVTTTGQATEVTIRGFGPAFNETLFDGRRIPSATGGRAFDFSGLSADMVSALEVIKSPNSSLSAGAIGATINVKYPRPFDRSGPTFVGAVSTSYAPDDGRFTPSGNFLFSTISADGRAGILIAGAYSKLAATQMQVSNWGWIGQHISPCQYTANCTPSQLQAKDISKPIWFTQDLSVAYNQIQEERRNARVAIQFQSSEKLLITVDGNYSRDSISENQYAYAIWNNGDEMRNIKTSSNGTIVDFTRFAPTDFNGNSNWGIQQTYDVGINVKYQATGHLSMVLDIDQAQSSLNPDDHISSASVDLGYGSSSGGTLNSTNFQIVQPGGHALPYYRSYGPNGDESRFADISIMGSHVTPATAVRNRNSINQLKLDGIWTDDDLTITFGGSYVADHFHMNYYSPWDNSHWQVWSGYGPDSGNPTGVHLPSYLFEGNIALRSIPGWTTVSNIPSLLKIPREAVWAYLDSLGVPTAETGAGSIAGFNWNCCLVDTDADGIKDTTTYTGMDPNKFISFSAGAFQQVFEDSFALHAGASTVIDVAGIPLKVNAGIRYEYTRVKATGISQPLTGLVIMPGDPTAYSYEMGASAKVSENHSYGYFLPNIDLVLLASDDVQLRFNASRTLTRPNMGDLRPTSSDWNGRKGSLGVSAGNPGELPFLSDNFDVSTEWYYAPNSYVSGDVFLKNVSNFVVTSTSTLVLDDVIDPWTGSGAVFTLTQPRNGPTAKVYGVELAWQHIFGDSGFGCQLNGTIVRSDKPYDPYNLTTNAFAVTGLADSANAVAFYDKNGFEIRLAANWRDTYLDDFGQSQSAGTQFGSEPVFVYGAWMFDASTSYAVTDSINVYLEATNLLDVAYSTRGRFTDQVLDVVTIGRRFTLGLHFRT